MRHILLLFLPLLANKLITVAHAQGTHVSDSSEYQVGPEYVSDESLWEGPDYESVSIKNEVDGISLIDLFEQGPDENKATHSGYTLIVVQDTPHEIPLSYVRNSIHKLLLSAQEAYLDIHREGGGWGQTEKPYSKESEKDPIVFSMAALLTPSSSKVAPIKPCKC